MFGRLPGTAGGSGASHQIGLSQSASPITPTMQSPSMGTAATAATSAPKRLHFRPSPYYEVVEYVSSVAQVPEAPPPSTRQNVGVSFWLSEKQVAALNDTQQPHQLRLFCTTYEYFLAAIGRNQEPAPVEFPYTSEARVNERSLGVSLKGTKKQPGRVSPPNLDRNGHLAVTTSKMNRVELSYANAPQRHLMVVALCRVTSAETLTAQLKQKRIRTKEEVVLRLQKQAEDDEIVMGASTLKLTCPLTYMRMTMPCRADTCDHVQCFDAASFFSLNEQSPQWLCPVCSRKVEPDDLRLDGYVEDILRRVPDSLESVLVESDGSWHSADDAYSSSKPPAPSSAPDAMPLDSDDETPDLAAEALAAIHSALEAPSTKTEDDVLSTGVAPELGLVIPDRVFSPAQSLPARGSTTLSVDTSSFVQGTPHTPTRSSIHSRPMTASTPRHSRASMGSIPNDSMEEPEPEVVIDLTYSSDDND